MRAPNATCSGRGGREPTPPTPPPRGLLKKSHSGSALNFTPPLRVGHPEGNARQRDKGEARRRVGGGSFYPWPVPPPNRPSHKPLGLFVGLPEEDRPTLKGGVILLSSRQVIYARFRNQNFFNSPYQGGFFLFTPLTRGGRGGWFSSREGRPLCSLKRGAFSTSPMREVEPDRGRRVHRQPCPGPAPPIFRPLQIHPVSRIHEPYREWRKEALEIVVRTCAGACDGRR